MKHLITRTALLLVLVSMGVTAIAAEGEGPEVKVVTDLELFYEMSDDVGGAQGDNDKFKANQLYLDISGKFDKGLGARLKLDGADIVSSDGKVVTEKIIEEANFTLKEVCGSPVTLVFGKDEMPFGMDYDEYLNDSIAHQFEIDKVWGINASVPVPGLGKVTAGTYQHRHSLKSGETRLSADNQLGDNYAARLTIDKLSEVVSLKVSASSEAYADISAVTVDDVTGISSTATHAKEDESRLSAGILIKCPKKTGNINAEYTSFSNMKGSDGNDPSLITLGLEVNIPNQPVVVWGRIEMIDDDTAADVEVENEFYSVGIKYSPTKNYSLLAEYSNFNSGDMSDAKDLVVAKSSIAESILLGVKAKF